MFRVLSYFLVSRSLHSKIDRHMNKYCVFLMQKPLAQMTCKESSFIFSYERWIAMFMTCRDFQNDFMCYLFIFLDLMMIPSWSPASLSLSLYTHSHCADRGLKVIFSQHTIQREPTVSVSLPPASFLLPCSSLPCPDHSAFAFEWTVLFCLIFTAEKKCWYLSSCLAYLTFDVL